MLVGKLDGSFSSRVEKSRLCNLYIGRAIVAFRECIKSNLDLVVYQRDCCRRLENRKNCRNISVVVHTIENNGEVSFS